MFQSARIKLTLWYLLIIMSVSGLFSLFIYISTTAELERGFRRAEIRLKAEELGIKLPRNFPRMENLDPKLQEMIPRAFFIYDMELAKRQVRIHLFMINGVIFIISSMAGYFLAGKTLNPIEKAMDDQKRFIDDASHELRTPLTSLKTTIEVNLRDKNISKETKQVLSENLEDVDNLELLANNLLYLSRYSKKANNFDFQNHSVKNLVDKVKKSIKAKVKDKNIELTCSVSPKELSAKLDRSSFLELLTIFLDNAVKYTPKKGKVSLAIEKKDSKLLILIKDTGMGIEKKHLPHIFKRFYRVDTSRSKSKETGFGLGLSLAKNIIDVYDGRIHVESVPEKGTTFEIHLPIAS